MPRSIRFSSNNIICIVNKEIQGSYNSAAMVSSIHHTIDSSTITVTVNNSSTSGTLEDLWKGTFLFPLFVNLFPISKCYFQF